MAATAKNVWKLIKAFGPGVIFTTSQLLSCGIRNTIDKCLSRFVQKGLIMRLAAGVFMIPDSRSEPPSAFEIIKAKAIAFKKRISSSSKELHSFITVGCKTSFASIHGRLHFKPVCAKKFEKILESNNGAIDADTQQEKIPVLPVYQLLFRMQELASRVETRLHQHLVCRNELRENPWNCAQQQRC